MSMDARKQALHLEGTPQSRPPGGVVPVSQTTSVKGKGGHSLLADPAEIVGKAPMTDPSPHRSGGAVSYMHVQAIGI